ncbi:MAG: ABC transporter permease subunit [Oscillospiraceae bacterium]|jgi:ABC-type transport system involved in multi-copper enzyme maturation permease subunit|nr:ABC transporter permease subunit [Oscillospiraceae bacterium]
MIKLLRVIKCEWIKLFSKRSMSAAFLLVFLLAMLTAYGSSAIVESENITLPSFLKDGIAGKVFSNTEFGRNGEIDLSFYEKSRRTADGQNGDALSGSDLAGEYAGSVPVSGSDAGVSVSDSSEEFGKDTWQSAYYQRINELTEAINAQKYIAGMTAGAEKYRAASLVSEYEREKVILTFCLTENTPREANTPWNTVVFAVWLLMIPCAVILFTAASNSFAGELKSGTIKTMLSLPATRLKFFFGKLIVLNIYTFMLVFSAWLGAVTGSLLGFGSLSQNYGYILTYGEDAYLYTWFSYSLMAALGVALSVVVITHFCVMVSTVTRSYAAAIAVPSLVLLISLSFGGLLASFGNPVVGATLFCNLDLSLLVTSLPNFSSVGVLGVLLSIAAHMFVFAAYGYFAFRRDVV